MSQGLSDVSLGGAGSPSQRRLRPDDQAVGNSDPTADELDLSGWAAVDQKPQSSAPLESQGAPPGSAAASFAELPAASTDAAVSTPPGWFGCLSVAYYRPFFNVDTQDVLERLRCVLLPVQAITRSPRVNEGGQELRGSSLRLPTSELAADQADAAKHVAGASSQTAGGAAADRDSNPFLDGEGGRALEAAGGDQPVLPVPLIFSERPDLYGPLWLSLTMAFAVGAASNLSGWFTFDPQAEDSIWHYDFARVTTALSCSLGFATVVPLVAWATLQYLGRPLPLVLLVCVQGYSLAAHLAAAVLCAIPMALIQWLAVALGAAGAGYFEWRVLAPLLGVAEGATGSDGRTAGSASGGDFDDSSLSAEARSAKQSLRQGLLACVVVTQLGMALMLKLFFLAAW